jgi:AraC-like DNA-binding protein
MPAFTFFDPHPGLSTVVDSIWDIDIPEAHFGQTLSIVVLPAVSPVLCFHFRGPTSSQACVNSGHHLQTITGVQTRAVKLRPGGPIGAVVVHLKPEAACQLLGGGMHEFTDSYIPIGDILSATDVSLLEDMLAEATGPAERIARVQAFLLRHLSIRSPDPVVRQAVQWLRRDPTLPVARLASRLELRERQLLRRFGSAIGTGPKQFANVARIGKAIAARRRGAGWAEIAGACGFTDQAHLTNAFHGMVGEPPEAFFRHASVEACRALNASLAVSDFYNTFFL